MIGLGTPQLSSKKTMSGRARTASSGAEDDQSASTIVSQNQTKDQPIDAPRTKLIITSYSRSPDASTAGSSAFGQSVESGARRRTTKIVESCFDSADNITILNDSKEPEDDCDDMTIDSTMRVIEESMQFSKSKINQKYKDKPLPGFIMLRKDLDDKEKNENQIIGGNKSYESSLSNPAVVHSAHTMHGKMTLRRGETGSNYHDALPMNETLRATSPVSGTLERLRIRGFKEPPRDYVQYHKLTPIDLKQSLRRYGYGKSPSAKSEALADVIESRYNEKAMKKLQVVESPLNKTQVDRTVRVPLYPGSPKSQHAEALERKEAKKQRLREKKKNHRPHNSSFRSQVSSHISKVPTAEGSVGVNDSLADTEDFAKEGELVDTDSHMGPKGDRDEGEEDETSVLSNHENFDLDAHLNEALFDAMRGPEKLDLDSSVDHSVSSADLDSCSTARSSRAASSTLEKKMRNQILTASVAQGPSKLSESIQEGYHLTGLGSQTTGFALSQGSGYRLRNESSSMKVKQSPTLRRRMKQALERKALKEQGMNRHLVVAPHGKNLDHFRLKNPTKTSSSARDPRPGALPQFLTPYYDPKTYRLPESLEDRLNNITPEEESEQLDQLMNQVSSSEHSIDHLPAQMSKDPHAWRIPFLGGRKVKFEDAVDTDDENEYGLDDQDDFEFSVGESSVGGDSQVSMDDNGEEGEEQEGTGAQMPALSSPLEREVSAQGTRQKEISSSQGPRSGENSVVKAHENHPTDDVGEDSLLTSSQVEDSMGDAASLDGPSPSKPGIETENSQVLTQSEFVHVNAGPDPDGFFPGADPQKPQAGYEQRQTLGKKTKDPFFQGHEAQENGSPSQAGNGSNSSSPQDGRDKGSPTGSVSRGLSASISLVRASIDDGGNVIAPPGAEKRISLEASLSGGAEVPSQESALQPGLPLAEGSQPPVATIGATSLVGVIPGGEMDNSLSHGIPGDAGNTAYGISLSSVGIEKDDQSSSVQSITSSIVAREAMLKKREEDELKKKRLKEKALAKLRAAQLAELQEAQSKKTMQFIQNHADPVTAKRTDYKFPEHGIQKPGVGEARLRHRDYAYDSMYMHHDGSMRSQKDEAKSSLLETVHLDVRLKSPASGSRPLTPSEREAREAEHMFRFLYTGSSPPTPNASHRKISHQIQMLEDDLRAHAQLQPDPVVRYNSSMVRGMPDPNDMSNPEYTTASQRFREEAEEARKRREEESLVAAEARMKKQEEEEEKALAAAGIKKPRRKKLQKPAKKVTSEPIPIAYSVGPTQGGVGASIVPSRVPSRVRKPKLRFTKEINADETLAGQTPVQKPEFSTGGSLGKESKLLPNVITPVKMPKSKLEISGGKTIFTRDNRALDPEGFERIKLMKSQSEKHEEKHNIWGDDLQTASTAQLELAKNLEQAMLIERRSNSSHSSRAGDSRNSRRNTILSTESPPGSAQGSIASVMVDMPSLSKHESTLSLHSGGLATMREDVEN